MNLILRIIATPFILIALAVFILVLLYADFTSEWQKVEKRIKCN